MSKSPFRARLEAAVIARHSRLNPFTEKWVKGELNRTQPGSWAAQHYQYVSQFPRWCARVHGERGSQSCERHCTTPVRHAEAIEAVRQATEMRWQYMTGLYRAFVAKEEM